MKWMIIAVWLIGCGVCAKAEEMFEKNVVPTSAGDLEITLIGHASLMFTFTNKVIHVDPFGKLANYAKLPKADLVLITHEHPDHLDPAALKAVRGAEAQVIISEKCRGQVPDGLVMKNGDSKTVQGIKVEALPACNLVHKRDGGMPFHPKGEGNGYVLTFGDKRVYVAGDTENTAEMKALKDIDVAFLPMNLPYTMTPEMVADAAKAFLPKILYPYHFGETDATALVALLKDTPRIEVRVRKMK